MYFDEPNYSKYTREELLEALQNINYDKFPDRAKLIEEELKSRVQVSDATNERLSSKIHDDSYRLAKHPLSNLGRVFYFIVGLLFLIFGIKELVTGKVAGKAGTITMLDSSFTFSFAVVMDFIIAGIAFYIAIRSPSKTNEN